MWAPGRLDNDRWPAFASVELGALRLLLSGRTASAGRPMPDGRQPEPGGWNRFQVIVQDIAAEVDRLRANRVGFRNEILSGPGVPSVVTALNDAGGRGVRLRILLEAAMEHCGTLNYDPAATMRSRVPLAELFTWKERTEPFVDGKVHAKVAVVDGARAFITSANLTGYALEKNMEAGVLISGGPVPRTLGDHLQALIDVGIIGRA